MGCNCGKRRTVRTNTVAQPRVNVVNSASPIQAAKTFQSATIASAPQAPKANPRRTV